MNKKINLKAVLIILFATNLCANATEYKYEQYKLPFYFEKHFSKCDKILDQYYYLNCYNYTHKSSVAVAYKLNSKLVQQHIQKRPKFEADLKLAKKYRTEWSDFLHTGYDRGHILSNQSMNATSNAQKSTFLMSNVVAQEPEINRSLWLKAEKLERLITIKSTKDVQVLNLIHFGEKVKKIKNGISVPAAFSKIIIANESSLCFTIPNEKISKKHKLSNFKVDCEKLLNN